MGAFSRCRYYRISASRPPRRFAVSFTRAADDATYWPCWPGTHQHFRRPHIRMLATTRRADDDRCCCRRAMPPPSALPGYARPPALARTRCLAGARLRAASIAAAVTTQQFIFLLTRCCALPLIGRFRQRACRLSRAARRAHTLAEKRTPSYIFAADARDTAAMLS